MTRIISATYHTNIKVAEFIADDGRHLLRMGGTLPWRINNCGDLSSPVNSRGEPNPKLTRNFIGFASVPSKAGTRTYHFFIFPNYETGRTELEASLRRKYADYCIPQLVKKYAPDDDNDSAAYTRNILKATDIADDKKISELSDDEVCQLADAIEKLEGYHNDAGTRKEIWVPVSTIQASDGARPLADEEIVLRMKGKDIPVKSNAVGQFPPIPHPREPVQVLRRTPDDKLKEVGTIGGDKGQSYNLLIWIQRFLGMSGPDKPPADAIKQRQPFPYQVQPGDTLDGISKRFRTTAEEIKKNNGRFNDKLFPGEMLGIYGPLSQKNKPVKAAIQKVATKRPQAARTEPPAPPKTPVIATPTLPARSDEGEGKPLALLPADQRIAPWMVYATEEARRLKGMTEQQIEASGTNYHKAIKDGVPTMVGDLNAWCAAFVNWCLMKAGFPIENKEFFDSTAAKGRAHAFYEVKGRKGSASDGTTPTIRNPLYVQIEKPIYGAIAMVTTPSNHGSHVGFVYARESDNNVVILGGNQTNRIKFSTYNEKPTESKTVTVDGKKITKPAKPEHLMFFIPTAYVEQSKLEKPPLPAASSSQLNEDFGITTNGANPMETTR